LEYGRHASSDPLALEQFSQYIDLDRDNKNYITQKAIIMDDISSKRGGSGMDTIDRKILTTLQDDASLSVAEIGSREALSSAPCWKRIQRVEAEGVIKKRGGLIDQDKVGLGINVFVSIETGDHSQTWLDRFAELVGTMPEVMEFLRMAGDV